ncbi:hypothetical protein BRADI_4g23268v3 [Brachypodium distachyon]|uniref:Uncharacterized protein n=1 Tax=Brachypodium distachyon TaxID=15368 RepID=A0A2K2CPP4_BRADI|nr:hypothetical protein BRADI_4g23268v3 [Brachypodium distachyon]
MGDHAITSRRVRPPSPTSSRLNTLTRGAAAAPFGICKVMQPCLLRPTPRGLPPPLLRRATPGRPGLGLPRATRPLPAPPTARAHAGAGRLELLRDESSGQARGRTV